MLRRRLAALAALAPLVLLMACSPESTPAPEAPADVKEAAQDKARPSRIVSIVPALTETAFAVGLGPAVVGVSDFAAWPPQVRDKPRVGGLLDPNKELILSLKPDLILSAPSTKKVHAIARHNGIPLVIQETESLEDVYASYEAIGEAAGVPERAAKEEAALKGEVDSLTVDVPEGDRPRVLMVIGRNPRSLEGLYAAGPGTFLDELLQRAGGTNALPPMESRWASVSKEVLLANPPDVIIEFEADADADPAEETKKAKEAWSALPELKAVKAGRVHRLVGDHLLLPGPRVTETLKALRGALKGAGEE